MIAVYKRELNSYFKGMLGYLFAAFVLLFTGIYCMAYNLSGSYSNFEYALSSVGFVYLIAVPILSMRSVAEEKKTKTDQLLYSLPIRLSSVIIGKFLAMATVLALPTAVMAFYPLILSQFGTISYGPAYGTLIAFFMLGASLLSIGLFVSSVTESQVAAAVISLVVMLLLYFINGLASFVSTTSSASLIALSIVVLVFAAIFYLLSKNILISFLTLIAGVGGLMIWYTLNSSAFIGLFSDIMEQMSVFSRFDGFVDGVFDVKAIVYFLSIIVIFLFLSVQALEKRRWSE